MNANTKNGIGEVMTNMRVNVKRAEKVPLSSLDIGDWFYYDNSAHMTRAIYRRVKLDIKTLQVEVAIPVMSLKTGCVTVEYAELLVTPIKNIEVIIYEDSK